MQDGVQNDEQVAGLEKRQDRAKSSRKARRHTSTVFRPVLSGHQVNYRLDLFRVCKW